MENIIITAESGSDVPENLAEKYGIHIVPMHVSFGLDTKPDRSFPPTKICEFYEETKTLPKTSGCTPQDFISVFDQIHKKWPEKSILHLAYSAVTTCSYQSAQIAAQGRDYVACVDTKHVSMGQTAAIIRIAEEIEKHREWTLREAAMEAERLCTQVRMCFLPQDLEYIRAGGRVSNAAALCGSLLNIHPCIELQNGYLKAAKKYRGNMGKLVPRLMRDYTEIQKLNRDEVWLGYTVGLSEEIKMLAVQTANELDFKKIHWIEAGCVITTHGGPGAFALAGYTDL